MKNIKPSGNPLPIHQSVNCRNHRRFGVFTVAMIALLGISLSVEGAILQKETIAALKATTGMSDGDLAIVEGYYGSGDRGGGKFKFKSSSSATDDGGRYIAPNSGSGRWHRKLDGEIPNVRMWGAMGNWHGWWDYSGAFAHDDTTAIQNAFNACTSTSDIDSDSLWAGELLFPTGTYKVTDTLVWYCWAIKLRGEIGVTLLMPAGMEKDILRGATADQIIKGMNPAGQSDLNVRIEDLGLRFQGWETNRTVHPTNACLVVSMPQEGTAIHNLSTVGGAYGIRCFGGGNGAPFALRDICASDATIAGVHIEPIPGESSCIGHVSISGVTGDYFGQAPSNSPSLVRFVNFLGLATIEDINAEGIYSGGVVQYKYPDASSGWTVNTTKGRLTIHGAQYNGTTGYPTNHFLVLKGGERTPSVFMQDLDLYMGGWLIKDEVSSRNVPAEVGGLRQTSARLPINYEAYYDTATNSVLGKRSRLVIGSSAVYSFTPTNTGWYRIMSSMGGGFGTISGKLTVRSYYREGAELELNVHPLQSDVWVNVLRTTKNGGALPPQVTKARAYYYTVSGATWAAVDVYVANLITSGDEDNHLTFTLPLEGMEEWGHGTQQLLAPTTSVSTGSGDTDGLPSGATYSVVSLVR